jgi:hypothetical protein
MARTEALAVFTQRREIGGSQQAGGTRVAQRQNQSLRDEFLAALGATRVEHGTAAARLHARTEPVRAGVLEIAGLESALGSHGTDFVEVKRAAILGVKVYSRQR